MSTQVVVAGGDARDVWLCRFLEDQGFVVKSFGFHADHVEPFHPGEKAPHIFIGPMTGIRADGSMTTMDGQVTLTLDILRAMGEGAVVAAGLIASPVKEKAQDLGLRTIEYRNQTTFMWLNAVPTAEGAIKSAIGRSGFTLYHRPIAILGFGRVGSILAYVFRRMVPLSKFLTGQSKNAQWPQPWGFPFIPWTHAGALPSMACLTPFRLPS